MTFAEALKKARQAAGLTQAQAAELLGVWPQTIRRWESGQTVPPVEPVPTQAEILSALGRSMPQQRS